MEAKDKPKVVAAATSQELLNKAQRAGAEISPTGSPIVGTAGLILGLSHFKKIDASLPLGRDTRIPAEYEVSQERLGSLAVTTRH